MPQKTVCHCSAIPYETRVSEALSDLVNHLEAKLSHVASAHNLSTSCLSNRFQGRTKATREAYLKQQNLPKKDEDALVLWIKEHAVLGLYPHQREVHAWVYEILCNKGDSALYIDDHWTIYFIARQPKIATTITCAVDNTHVLVITKTTIHQYFDILEEAIYTDDIQPEDTWNFDEKGFVIGHDGLKNKKIIIPVKTKQPMRQQEGSRKWVTLIECISASGSYLPVFYITPGKRHIEGTYTHIEFLDDNTDFAKSHNGWTDYKLGLQWIKYFAKYAIPSYPSAMHLLINDNHDSHDTYEFKEYCNKLRIKVLFLPSHATHILQPLDVAVFSLLDWYYHQKVNDFVASQPLHTPIHTGDCLFMAEKARTLAIYTSTIISGFATTGIYPLNRVQILTHPSIKDDTPKSNCPGLWSTLTKAQQLNQKAQQSIASSNLSPKGKENVTKLGEKCESLESLLGIHDAELKTALTRQKPADTSRKVLSHARVISKEDLITAHKTRQTQNQVREQGGRRGKSARWCRNPGSQVSTRDTRVHGQARAESETIYCNDSEVEQQIDELEESSTSQEIELTELSSYPSTPNILNS